MTVLKIAERARELGYNKFNLYGRFSIERKIDFIHLYNVDIKSVRHDWSCGLDVLEFKEYDDVFEIYMKMDSE